MSVPVVVLALVCVVLWLSEKVPAFVPTLLLVACAPLLTTLSADAILDAGASPVLALFFGGFVLAAAAEQHGLDRALVALVVRATGGHRRRIIAGLVLVSAFLSMWMSNVAAAALLVQVVKPLVAEEGGGAGASPSSSSFRTPALLAVAFGCNLGGIATPIGTGPNAIALAATHVSFAGWMAFALPITALLCTLVVVLLLVVWRVAGRITAVPQLRPLSKRGWCVVFVFSCCAAGWLTEPLHGVDAALVAVFASFCLFATGLVERAAFARLDWSTLFLIGGGLVLGAVLEKAGVFARLHGVDVAVVIAAAAVFSALMSNTATATVLVPLALSLDPAPSTAVLVAVACSVGAPFAISTPPNALVAGAGVSGKDLFIVGLPVMVAGVAIVAASGPWVLARFGL